MQILICGAGKVTRDLLPRLGDIWQITLMDISEEGLNDLIRQFQSIQKAVGADASSPVALDDIGVGAFDYVLALTDNDQVNLAVVRHARSRGVSHLLALVNEQDNLQEFWQVGARTVPGSALLAQNIHHYLEDPRIKVTPLAFGQGEVMEVDASHYVHIVGKRVEVLRDDDRKLAAIFRDNRVLFPNDETIIQAEDRLVLVGRPGNFAPVCDILECGHPHFPLAYGQGLLVGLASQSGLEKTVAESIHLARNTKVKHINVLCSDPDCETPAELETWCQSMDIRFENIQGDLLARLQGLAPADNYGLVIVEPLKPPLLKLLAKSVLIALAHSLPCPLLVARHTYPYERILVPFKANPMGERALEVAIDLAKQFQAEVAVIVVEEHEVVAGLEDPGQLEGLLEKVREIGHIYKFEVQEIVRKGNPVKEIIDEAKGFNLMILGSTSRDKGLLTPHVGELLAMDAPCSVLIVSH